MSSQRKAARRQEIEAVRCHAIAAARAGKPRSSCPYRYCDQYQWQNAYDAEIGYKEPPPPEEVTIIRNLLGVARDAVYGCDPAIDAAEKYLASAGWS